MPKVKRLASHIIKSLGVSKLVGLNMVSNENNVLNTFCLQETVFSSSRTLLKTIRVQTKIKPFPMSELTGIQESTSGKSLNFN